MTGRTEFYDFDSWYSNHFERQQNRKIFREKKQAERVHKKEANAQMNLHFQSIIVGMVILLLVTIGFENLGDQYTTRYDPKALPEKKDK